MQSSPTLNLIGCGRAASTLARLWNDAECIKIQDVLTRSLDSATARCRFIGEGRPVESLYDMQPANYWLIGTPDSSLAAVTARLVTSPVLRPGDGVFHLSGFTPSAAFIVLAAGGIRTASAHPVLSFADPASAAEQFPGTPCGIEGETSLCAELEACFKAIGGECFSIAPEQKPLYHAGTVFASNFLVVIMDIAQRACIHAGVPKEVAGRLLAHLAHNALDNVLANGGSASITGPAARGDSETVAAQQAAVEKWQPAAGQAYATLSKLAAQLAQGGHSIH